MLLEKAWVKGFGRYVAAVSVCPAIMMEDLTMAPSRYVEVRDVGREFEKIRGYGKEGYIVVLSSVAEKAPKGIIQNQTYSLLGVYSFKVGEEEVKLFKIRNPWGHFVWEGEYGTYSKKWTNDLKAKTKMV